MKEITGTIFNIVFIIFAVYGTYVLTKLGKAAQKLSRMCDEMHEEVCPIEKGDIGDSKMCNGCEFLNIDEYRQDLIKTEYGVCPLHICKKYNKRVTHFPYSEPYIYPCNECLNTNPTEKDGVE